MKIIKFLSLLLLLCIHNSYMGVVDINPISHLRIEWEQYKEKYNLIMNEGNNEERFKVFAKNTNEIKRLNSQNSGVVYGMNKFGHWTAEEFMNYVNRGLQHDKNRPYVKNAYTESGKNYSDIDWRKKGVVTAVKNQGSCGSCWAFSAAGQLESQYAIFKNKTIDLSVQDLVDCSREYGSEGCSGGMMDEAFAYVKKNGINSEKDYPYVGKDLKCKHTSKKSILKVDNFFDLPKGNESALCDAVSTIGPISVPFAVTVQFQFYKNGVFVDKKCTPSGLNHGMLLVGLGSTPSLHYIVKNSWGTDWGMGGYILIARDKNNMCGIASLASYATVIINK